MADTEIEVASEVSTEELRHDTNVMTAVLQSLSGITRNSPTITSRIGNFLFLKKEVLESIYCYWLGRKICDTFPIEANKNWLELKLNLPKQEQIDEINKSFALYTGIKRLDVRAKLTEAQVWANLYGGAVVVMIIDDGEKIDEPVNRDKIRTIKELVVLDRHKVVPYVSSPYMDVTKPEYYNLNLGTSYSETLQEIIAKTGMKIHESRVIRFDGIPLPPDVMRRNFHWGQSVIESVFTELMRDDSVYAKVQEQIETSSFFVHSMEGLRDAINKNKTAVLRESFLQMFIMMKLMGGFAIDKEEKAEWLVRQFAGVPEIMSQYADRIVAATGIPKTILFGIGAVGLAAQGTGDTELNVFRSNVSNYQQFVLHPKYDRLIDYIMLAKDGPGKGKIPDDFDWQYRPLAEPDPAAEITARSNQATTDNTYVQAGILLKEEVRKSRFGGRDYSFETTLDDKLWEEQKKQENEQNLSAQGGGDFGSSDLGGGFDYGGEQQYQGDSLLLDRVRIEAASKFRSLNSPYARLWMQKEMARLSR